MQEFVNFNMAANTFRLIKHLTFFYATFRDFIVNVNVNIAFTEDY